MKCPYCNQEHPADFQFCPRTGRKIEHQNKACTNEQCSAYGKYVLPHDAEFCPNCGCAIVSKVTTDNKETEDEELTFSMNGGVSFSMIKVKAGSFTMGGNFQGETPMHKVILTKDYYIGKLLVTKGLYDSVMNEEDPTTITTKWFLKCLWAILQNDIPIDISWNDCQKFINKLNDIFQDRLKQLGMQFRLPTEAEWEYAARGGSKSNNFIYAGSNVVNEVAWYDENSGRIYQSVGKKKPNELGLYDMSGNRGEWCYDSFMDYTTEVQTDPLFSVSNLDCVVRGGNYNSQCNDCRLSARSHASPLSSSAGMRLCLSEIRINI